MHTSYVSTYTHIAQFHRIRSPNRAIPLGFYVPSVSSCLIILHSPLNFISFMIYIHPLSVLFSIKGTPFYVTTCCSQCILCFHPSNLH